MKRIAFLLVLVLFLVSCAQTPEANTIPPATNTAIVKVLTVTRVPSPAPTKPIPPLKIGLLTDRSGDLAHYGAMLENGFGLGLDYATSGKNTVAGRTIQVVVKDTGSQKDQGLQAARDLIEKDAVDVLVGAPSSDVTLAVADLAKQAKKILIAQPASSADLTGKNFNPYVFRTSRTTDQDWLASRIALNKLGKTFVQIAPETPAGHDASLMLYNAVRAGGGRFVINDTPERSGTLFIPPNQSDFTPYLQTVKNTRAEVLVVLWGGTGITPLFAQLQQMGLLKTMQVFTGMGDNQTVKSGYTSAVGVNGLIVYHYSLPKTEINEWLVKNHTMKFQVPPDVFTEEGFTAAQMVIAGLQATNGDATGDKLIPVLENLSFDGPKGKYTVRDYDHVLLQPMYIVKLTNTTDGGFRFFDLLMELKPEETAPGCRLEGEYAGRCK